MTKLLLIVVTTIMGCSHAGGSPDFDPLSCTLVGSQLVAWRDGISRPTEIRVCRNIRTYMAFTSGDEVEFYIHTDRFPPPESCL